MTDQKVVYRGFSISWQEPPLTPDKWAAIVTSESTSLRHLVQRGGAKIVQGGTRCEMLADAERHIDGLYARTRVSVPGVVSATVREIFMEALAKKSHDVPWPEIHDHLIDRGHDVGSGNVEEAGGGDHYELTFVTGEKISFDGADYQLVRT
jgi:hypothetical protein